MVIYKCDVCVFATIRKNQYERHLKTKKHLRKTHEYATQKEESENEEILPHYTSQPLTIPHNIFTEKKGPKKPLTIPHKNLNLSIENDTSDTTQKNAKSSLTIPHKKSSQSLTIPHNPSQSLTDPSLYLTDPSLYLTDPSLYLTNENEKKVPLECEYCSRKFDRKDNLDRHLAKYCKVKKDKTCKLEKEVKQLKKAIVVKDRTEDTMEAEQEELEKTLERREEKYIEKLERKEMELKIKETIIEKKETIIEKKESIIEEKKSIIEEKERCIKILLERTKELKQKHYTIINNNLLEMKAPKFLNSYCMNNPTIQDVYNKIKNSEVSEEHLENISKGMKYKSEAVMAGIINDVITDKNKELIEEKGIKTGTCEGVIFSNDGSRRKYIAKGDNKWDYYQNDKYIDNIILDLLFRASQKYNVVMTLTKPQRNKIIKQIKEMNDYNSKMDTLLDNIVGPMDTVVKEDITKKESSEEEEEGTDESDREEIGGDDESEYEYYQIEIDAEDYDSDIEFIDDVPVKYKTNNFIKVV